MDFLIRDTLHTFSGVINQRRAAGLGKWGSGIAGLKFMRGVRHPKAEWPYMAPQGQSQAPISGSLYGSYPSQSGSTGYTGVESRFLLKADQ